MLELLKLITITPYSVLYDRFFRKPQESADVTSSLYYAVMVPISCIMVAFHIGIALAVNSIYNCFSVSP